MEDSNRYDQEVDLKALIFAVLYKWRPILLVAILAGILLGGVRLAKGLIKMQDTEEMITAKETFEDEYALYENTKESCEREIENITLKVESFQDYMEESVLMQISPYDKPVATADIYIKSDYEIMPGMIYQNQDYTDSLIKAYGLAIGQGTLLKGVDRLAPFSDVQYMTELIVARADYDNKMLHVEVTYSDMDTADRILSQVLKNLDGYTQTLSESMGVHEISVTNRSKFHVVDTELVDKQNNNRNTEASLQSALVDKKAVLKDLEEPKFTAHSKKAALKSGIKYGILGGVLGAFGVIFFLCIGFLLSDKLISEKELRSRFGLCILGVFGMKHNNKFLSGVDCWLDRMRGALESTDTDTAYKLISANVQNYTDNKDTIMVFGTVDDATMQQASETLSQLLPDRKILLAGNMNQTAEAIQKLPLCDKVILVERRGESTYTGLERELGTIKAMEKSVVGCILY